MASLGVPAEYEAFIVDSLTQTTILRLPWSQINWQRLNRGVSAASVSIDPNLDNSACCSVVSSLYGWKQMLVIERNGHRVWDGLIVSWSTGSAITINAFDRSVMFGKRLIGEDLTVPFVFGNDGFPFVIEPLLNAANIYTPAVDPVVAAITNQMPCTFELADPRYLFSVSSSIGATMGGTWRVATLSPVASVFQQLASASCLNFTQRCEKFMVSLDLAEYAFNGASPDDLGMLPTVLSDPMRMRLSPYTTVSDQYSPAVTFDATDAFTVGYGGGVGQGIAGFVQYGTYDYTGTGAYVPYSLHGVLSEAQTESGIVYFDTLGAPQSASLDSAASPRVSLEQMQLAPTFGGDILKEDLSNLVPGIGLIVDFPDSCALDAFHSTFYITGLYFATASRITLCRLEDISFAVSADSSGINETVNVSVSVMADAEGA